MMLSLLMDGCMDAWYILTYTLYARLPIHMYFSIGPVMHSISSPLRIPGTVSYSQYLRLPGLLSTCHVSRVLTHSMGYVYSYTGYYTCIQVCGVLMGYYMLLRMYAPPVTLLVWLVLLGEQMLQLYPQMLTLGHCITWDGVTYALATSCGQVLH